MLKHYFKATEALKRLCSDEQGVVSLRFTIDAAGHVLAASVTKPSGSDALDKEVLAAVKRADPLPRIPNIFGRDKLDLVVPVEFVLR